MKEYYEKMRALCEKYGHSWHGDSDGVCCSDCNQIGDVVNVREQE